MNHCLRSRISMGVWHLQHWPTSCCSGSVFSSKPSLFRSVMMAFLASWIVNPAYFPASLVIFPFSLMDMMMGSLRVFTVFTSALSP